MRAFQFKYKYLKTIVLSRNTKVQKSHTNDLVNDERIQVLYVCGIHCTTKERWYAKVKKQECYFCERISCRRPKLYYSKSLLIIKRDVFLVLYCEAGPRTVNEEIINKLNTLEMWVYRRILKIQWTQHITNEVIANTMGKEI